MKKSELIENVKMQAEKNRAMFIDVLNGLNTISEVKGNWNAKQYITPANNAKKYNVTELKAVIVARYDKLKAKKVEKDINEINEIFNAGSINEINVSIEWKRSQTWGANPTATVNISGDKYEYFTSGSISGCGYDKESTAFASAINKSKAFRKLMFENADKLNNLYGWGKGYGTLSGGVGVSCYYSIFEAMGYKMKKVGNGKMFDAYYITKK